MCNVTTNALHETFTLLKQSEYLRIISSFEYRDVHERNCATLFGRWLYDVWMPLYVWICVWFVCAC